MRKFILVTTMVLVSAAAHAGESRSLTIASNEPSAASEPSSPSAQPAEAQPAEAPAFVQRPAAIDSKIDQPIAATCKPASDKIAQAPQVEKPKRRHVSMEARVISELHRHGIYW